MCKYLAGETEQSRLDLERLALVRRRREEQAMQRKAEGRAPGWSADGIDSDADEETLLHRPPKAGSFPAPAPVPISESAAPAEEEIEDSADGGPRKLKPTDIKQMNGDTLKEHLKASGLPTQGQKKDLMKRLSGYEAGRP